MGIYRGVGGTGDATTDIEVNTLSALTLAAQTAAIQANASASGASSSASTATTQASNASTSASSAATSATNASSSATSAASSATNAASSATAAASSATAAAASAASINDANLVHKTGNETIGGIKTFSSGLTFNDASTQNTAATGFGFKNRIINGNMTIDQRNAGASVTPTASGYMLDRWWAALTQSSKYSVQQTTVAPAGLNNSVAITSLSAYSIAAGDFFLFRQYIEGFNFADMGWGTASAQPITMSFWVRSSLVGTFGAALQNSAQNRSYPLTYVISAANTWEHKTVTVLGDTAGTWEGSTNGVGLRITFGLGVGSTYSGVAGTWAGADYRGATGAVSVVGTSGATFYITGVQLEKGSTATSFDYRPYGTELALCQRYYQKTGGFFAATQVSSELNAVGSCNVKVDMRANPTATLPAGSSFHKPGIAFYAISSVDAGPQANGDGYQVCVISSGAGAGAVGQISQGLILSAEL